MHDVIIIGAGPAGLSAALWCDQLGLDTLVLEAGAAVGGQLQSIHHEIENYLGLRAGSGRELCAAF
ncbi:MAG TPA: FAD-dependent oxidoreductase, partial [Pyrinomonadaceae bacterium]